VHVFLTNRKIIDILIGDRAIKVREKKITLPYLSGPDLVGLSNELGYLVTYGSQSRWVYMNDLIEFLIGKDDISRLFKRHFSLSHFDSFFDEETQEELVDQHKEIVNSAMNENIGLELGQLFLGAEVTLYGHYVRLA